MEPSGQSTCSAAIFTKFSGSQLQQIPLHYAEQYLISNSFAEEGQKYQGVININNRYNNLHSKIVRTQASCLRFQYAEQMYL